MTRAKRTARLRSVKRTKPTGSSARRTAKRAAAKKATGRAASRPTANSRATDSGAARKGPAGRSASKRSGAKAQRGRAAGRSASGGRGKPVAGRPPRSTQPAGASRWLAFVEEHGVVLASARGPVPSVAEAVAGQPIIGSWWAHPKGKAIFAALSELDDANDVRCFKLIDGKVTFVHRRVWPALACLAGNGVIAAERAAAIQQEHMPTGEHRNLVTPYPDWVPDDVARAAAALTVEAARAQLGAWL